MVLVILGVLGALVAPRMLATRNFASRGFYDEAQSVVRFAQKTAIAWRRPIVVCVSASEFSAISNADCNAPTAVLHPVSGAVPKSTAPDGVTLSPVGSFSFDGMDRPSASTTITLTSNNTGDPARQILVAAETGYVSHI